MLNGENTLRLGELDAVHRTVSVKKYGFFLCLQGSAKVLLGTQVYEISKNHLCIYAPNNFLRILQRSDDLQGVLMEEDFDELHHAVSLVEIRQRIKMRDMPCVLLSDEQTEGLCRYLNFVRNGQVSDNGSNELSASIVRHRRKFLLSALCMEVFNVYFSTSPTHTGTPDREESVLNRFLVSLYTNYNRMRTVQFYAKEQCLSPYYFSNLIKSRSGKSAMEWIESVVISFAKQFLEHSDKSVKEIAHELNFPDQSTFGRYFKRYEGVSPSDYRNKIKE